MLRPQMLGLALSAVALVAAQTANFTINPNEVDAGTRATWCQGELNVCRSLCANHPKENDCDTNTLKFTCTCQNGTAPGLQYYAQSMPSFICQRAFEDCIAATDEKKAQDACINNIQKRCGTLDANKADTGDSSGSSPSNSAEPSKTASKTASKTDSASGTESTPTASTKPNAAPMNVVVIGNVVAVVAAGLFAAFL